MPACAIDVSFCGAATTASTSPDIAVCTAAAQNAIDARPATGDVTPKPREAVSGCGQVSTLIRVPDQSAAETRSMTLSLAFSPHDFACRFSKAGSHTMIGSQAAHTRGSSTALRQISGPMPAGSPTGIAILAWPAIIFSQPRHQRRVDHVRYALAADRLDRLVDLV